MNGLPATITGEISTPAVSVPVIPAGEVGIGAEEYPIIEIPGAGSVKGKPKEPYWTMLCALVAEVEL